MCPAGCYGKAVGTWQLNGRESFPFHFKLKPPGHGHCTIASFYDLCSTYVVRPHSWCNSGLSNVQRWALSSAMIYVRVTAMNCSDCPDTSSAALLIYTRNDVFEFISWTDDTGITNKMLCLPSSLILMRVRAQTTARVQNHTRSHSNSCQPCYRELIIDCEVHARTLS